MTLHEFQKARGMNLTELAGFLGLPVTTLNGYLLGTRRPAVRLLDRISAATGGEVTPAELRPDLLAVVLPRAVDVGKREAAAVRRRLEADDDAAAARRLAAGFAG